MATKEPPKSGLFAKVARFVANPTTNWQELDVPSTISQAQDPRQADRDAMKALIEVKRRNDFVRQREFNMLRKIRQKEAGLKDVDRSGAKPSFFQSSLPSRDGEKANTLKKINEIEAQMSMQWWTTKHANSSILNSSTFGSSLPQTMAPEPGRAPGRAPAAAAQPENLLEFSLDEVAKPASPTAQPRPPAATGTTGGRPVAPAPASAATPPTAAPASKVAPAAPMSMAPTAPMPTPSSTEYSASKMFAIEVDEIMHNPNLEEAAIRFANGDDEGAEQALKDALVADASGHQNEDAWLALFDLYRASGNQARFESAAIDYANYFQRSSPQWISFPDLLQNIRNTSPSPETSGSGTHWKCPASLGVQTVAALKAAVAKQPPPWQLDWSKLARVEDAALDALYELVHSWCENASVQLRMEGSTQLEEVLASATPAGDKEVDHRWWHLRMETLRMLHRPDEFEMVALDYCVTYEVSPPSWTVARCKCKSAAGANELSQQASLSIMSSSISLPGSNFGSTAGPSTELGAESGKLVSIEISGHIQGDPQSVIDRLNKSSEGYDVLVVSCEKLIRIDFSAAGTLLNWVISQQQQGKRVQFVQVHRLILAFFHVIGITDHALTSVRMH